MIVVNQKPTTFQPVNITITDPTTLADFVGALSAYGKGKLKAKKSIRQAGLLEHYSGNARKTARTLVVALADAGVIPSAPDFGPGATGSVNEDMIGDDMDLEVAA